VQRVFGAIAIFAGWLSIVAGAMWGLISSEFIGLAHKEGDVPPSAVYGISGAVVLWVFTAAAIVTAVPLAAAMVADDPRRQLRWFAQGFAIVGVALLPDELGRSFGLPLLAGAACMWIGGELIHREALAFASAQGGSQTPEPAAENLTGATSVPLAAAVRDSAASTQAAAPAALSDSAAGPGSTGAPTEVASEPAEGRGRRRSRRRSTGAERLCPWCSTAVPVDAESCPNCEATLDAPAADQVSIPGLTEVPPSLQRYAEKAKLPRTSLLSMILGSQPIPTATDAPPPSDAAAMRPPSRELRAEMARLDAEIAAGTASFGAEGLDEAPSGVSGESAEPAKEPRRPAQRRRSGPRT
jgi:hypothetical protein